MSAIGRSLKTAVGKLQAQSGRPSFTWSSYQIPCLENTPKLARLLGVGGFSPTADLSLFVRADDLPDPGPQLGHTLMFSGRSCRINMISPLPGGEDVFRFDLVHPTRGTNAK